MSRREWNRTADEFEESVCDIAAEETNNQLQRFVSAAHPSPQQSVLVDLGCGKGSFVQKFGRRFHDVIAVDFSSRIVARAREAYTGTSPVRWMVADVGHCPKLLGQCADLTVCLNVITSASAARRKSLWASVKAVTKLGGHMLVVVPSLESSQMVAQFSNPRGARSTAAATRDGIVDRSGNRQKHYGRDELASIIAGLGFTVVSLGRVSYPWSTEGLRKPRSAIASPFDWICLAQRTAA